ncbi:MAG: hypothetical protein L0220_08835 [Acidobacteria bacterium]|nr:hypothetical protein [Acidobacteriota bacterium]
MNCESVLKICEADIRFLQQHWENLMREYNAHPCAVENLFSYLTRLYSARGRAYHNLSHIRSLLALSDSYRGRIQNYPALCFAIWFHDAVYNTRKRDNEELSAELAAEKLSQFKIPVETIELVRQMVLATKEHRNHGFSEDINFFLDFDLSILGSEDQVYQSYSEAIRKEYWWVPTILYRQGRRKVLESFLERESIYFTSEMAQKYEQQARRNIKREIESLF